MVFDEWVGGDDPVRIDGPVYLASAPDGRGGDMNAGATDSNGVSVEWIDAGSQTLRGGNQPTDDELSDVW